MKRRVAIGLSLAAVVALAPVASASLKLGTTVGSRVVSLKWATLPVRYFVTNRDVPGVTAPQLQAAVQQSFGAWAAVSTASVSSQFAGFTSADPSQDDGVSVIGFKARGDLDRTLAATTFEVDTVTGAIVDSDIFINTIFDWSVAPAGEASRFDIQSILTHEIGHLFGLGHSMLGETELRPTGRRVIAKRAVMFPIAYPAGNLDDRTLEADDIAGISDIYSTAAFRQRLGSISGRVTLNGAGVFGAHVTAFNQVTGDLVGGFTLDLQGNFGIGGLTPGVYVVRAEPMDDADISSFFETGTVVNINFMPAYGSRLVAVPAGGSSASIEIKVTGK